MKIKFVYSTPGIAYSWLANEEVDVDGKVLTAELAEQFVVDGYAIDITPAKKKKKGNDLQEDKQGE